MFGLDIVLFGSLFACCIVLCNATFYGHRAHRSYWAYCSSYASLSLVTWFCKKSLNLMSMTVRTRDVKTVVNLSIFS